jgi:hypothetical protein
MLVVLFVVDNYVGDCSIVVQSDQPQAFGSGLVMCEHLLSRVAWGVSSGVYALDRRLFIWHAGEQQQAARSVGAGCA